MPMNYGIYAKCSYGPLYGVRCIFSERAVGLPWCWLKAQAKLPFTGGGNLNPMKTSAFFLEPSTLEPKFPQAGVSQN